jgi:hypothetical protein
MTDCPNAEMRDRLPDLLHEQLEMSVRAALMAHVDQCEDCRAEVALLREARIVLSPDVLAVDVVAISRVVIEKTRTQVNAGAHRSPWMDWRIAASLLLLLVGAGSVKMYVGSREAPAPVAVVADTSSVAPNAARAETVATAATGPSEPSSVVTAASAELSAAGSVSDLSESELRALLQELDAMDAVPSAEPEQVNVRVSLPGNGSSE